MACQAYNRAKGYDANTTFATVQNDIYSDGIGCINTNMPSCSTQCTNLTKTSQACYNCLSQYASCPASQCLTQNVDCSKCTDSDCANNPLDTCCCCTNRFGSCCPLAELAVQCGSCLAAHGNNDASGDDPSSWAICSQDTSLSSKTIIIIVVCVAVAVVVLIAVVVVVVKLKKQARAREKLVTNLQREGVNHRIIHDVQQLNYSNIDSSIFHDADVHLALQQASKRVQALPPPHNVAVTHLASETEGLFAL